MGEGRQGGSWSVLLRLGAEILAEVVTHVLCGHHHRGRKCLDLVTMPVSRPSVFAHLLSARKQFATFCAGDFLLVRTVFTNGLKREREIIIGPINVCL